MSVSRPKESRPRPPKVLFTCYPTAFQAPAGGEAQLLSTYRAVKRLGIHAELFDPWSTRMADFDVVHHFSIEPGGESIIRAAHEMGVGVALSTIIWVESEGRFPVGHVRHMGQFADLLLPNSRLEAERLAKTLDYPMDKFHVVHNGIDRSYMRKADPRPFERKFGLKRFVLCTARFDYRKNQLGLIRALKGTDLAVVFIGGVRDPEYLSQCRKEATPRMHFLGALPPDSPLLRSAYAACEVFVMPGLLETPGLAALEAGASGAKVVVTQEGSTREYFGDLATYVHPLAYRQMREAVLAAFHAKKDARLRRHLLRNFTWDRAGLQTLEAYRAILGSKRTPGRAASSILPSYVLRGAEPSDVLELGADDELQARLGWGERLETPEGPGRRMLRSRAEFYLLNTGRKSLRVEGFAETAGAMKIAVNGRELAEAPFARDAFALEFPLPALASEILECALIVGRKGEDGAVVVRKAYLS